MKKNIIWIYYVYSDLNSHITTWREMYFQLRSSYNIHYLFPLNKSKSGFTDTIHHVKLSRIFGAPKIAFSILAFFKFSSLYRKLRPEYVILDDWSFFYSVIRRFSKHKAIFIYDSRTPYYGQRQKKWQNDFLKSYIRQVLLYNKRYHDGLTCISNELRDLYEKDFRFKLNSKFCEWPSGVNLSAFKASLYQTRSLSQPVKMIFHGSLTHTRGLEDALEGLKLLKENHIDFEFHLYGEGHYVNKIKQKIQENDLNKEVRILAPVSYTDVPKMISGYDLAIMTYPKIDYWEGNVPLKLLEYIAMKKFVLCTDLKVFEKMAGDYPKMIFINNNDSISIRNGVLKYLEVKNSINDEDVEVDSIVNRYSWTTIAQDFRSFLESF